MRRAAFTACIGFLSAMVLMAATSAEARLGVLVVSKDRGTLGNQELEQAVEGLDPDLPVELLLIGPERQGIEDGYRGYIAAAAKALKAQDVDEILAIPLFFSSSRALLARFRGPIEAAMAPAALTWSQALGESYLAREILLDRIESASAGRRVSKLVLLLAAGGSSERDAEVRALGGQLLKDIAARTQIANMSTLLVDPERPAFELEAPEAGSTLIVPFISDVKFTPHMSFDSKLQRNHGGEATIIAQSLPPHPAISTWLKSRINAHIPPSEDMIGFVIMPHGSSAPYNDGIVAAMPELVERYPTAFAFGMASPVTIRQAVEALEAAGVRHAVFLRLFSLPHHFRDRSDFILGLRATPPAHGHGAPPERVRSAIRFVSLGGYQPDPLIAEILGDRILEVSEDPARESVLLLSHGSFSDAANAAGLAVVERNIDWIEQVLDVRFRDIRAMSLREDWPDKREAAFREIRGYLETANEKGRAIVVSNRLYGSGSYRKFLEGEEYVMNGQGLIPHPNFARWVETTLREGIDILKGRSKQASADEGPSIGASSH